MFWDEIMVSNEERPVLMDPAIAIASSTLPASASPHLD